MVDDLKKKGRDRALNCRSEKSLTLCTCLHARTGRAKCVSPVKSNARARASLLSRQQCRLFFKLLSESLLV
jgi:hypothetical protein